MSNVKEKMREFKRRENLKLIKPAIIPVATLLGYAIANKPVPLSTDFLCLAYSVTCTLNEAEKHLKNYCLYEQSVLRDSEEYKNLKEKYDLFLNEFVSLMKEYNFDDALTFNLLVSDLLSTGYFSYSGDFNYEYKLFKNNKKAFYEDLGLMGSRVFTDEGVCRHQAAFLTDVNNAYGNDAITLTVRGLTENNPLTKITVPEALHRLVTNHANTGICTEKGKIIVDPTWDVVAQFKDKNHAEIISCPEEYTQKSYFVGNTRGTYELINNNFDIMKISKFENSDFRTISDDEYKICHNEFSNILRSDKLKFMEFRKKNLKLIKAISELHKAYIDMRNGYEIDHRMLRREDDPNWSYVDHTNYLTSKDYEEMFNNRL